MKLSTAKKRLKGFANITNMCSPRSGNEVANQFDVEFDNGSLFKSYNSIIVIKLGQKVYLGNNWDYSKTTGIYRNQFLGEGIEETREKIKTGEYKMLQ